MRQASPPGTVRGIASTPATSAPPTTGGDRPPALVIQQVRTGPEVRRMAVLRRPVGYVLLIVVVGVLALGVVLAAGRGGGQDGALGAMIALVVLVVGTVLIQRLSAGRRLLLGFNPDGIWYPAEGWVEWPQVRHLEVRQTATLISGKRNTIWVGFQPAEGEERWIGADPGYRRARTVALLDEMERCWQAARRPA